MRTKPVGKVLVAVWECVILELVLLVGILNLSEESSHSEELEE